MVLGRERSLRSRSTLSKQNVHDRQLEKAKGQTVAGRLNILQAHSLLDCFASKRSKCVLTVVGTERLWAWLVADTGRPLQTQPLHSGQPTYCPADSADPMSALAAHASLCTTLSTLCTEQTYRPLILKSVWSWGLWTCRKNSATALPDCFTILPSLKLAVEVSTN